MTSRASEADERECPGDADRWNKPTAPAGGGGPVTVLFTDLAGSTTMTQEFGDEKAQIVVCTHNTIFRAALQQYGGKEVKHTGDGILASFSTASGAIEGSIYIQHAVSKHNRNNRDVPVRIKIGINAGKAIQKDDDIFGATVQMSARVVDKCKADQILITDIVRQLCSRKKLPFTSAGGFEMKGFDGPVTLYQVPWAGRSSQTAAAGGSDN